MASALRDWFVMLATTRMTKSFKMVLLRVLLDNDAVFSGMPIPELAAKCREFLVAHEFLRRDIADAATGQPVEMSPRKWESSWRKFPISIWMQEQEGRSWFTIRADSLRVAFECDERLRGPLESLSGELVDFRLAAHARPRASATGFVAAGFLTRRMRSPLRPTPPSLSRSSPPRPPSPASQPTFPSTTSLPRPSSGARRACRRRSAGRKCQAWR
jgi:hypothetical protein